jgi:hypothetical protein
MFRRPLLGFRFLLLIAGLSALIGCSRRPVFIPPPPPPPITAPQEPVIPEGTKAKATWGGIIVIEEQRSERRDETKKTASHTLDATYYRRDVYELMPDHPESYADNKGELLRCRWRVKVSGREYQESKQSGTEVAFINGKDQLLPFERFYVDDAHTTGYGAEELSVRLVAKLLGGPLPKDRYGNYKVNVPEGPHPVVKEGLLRRRVFRTQKEGGVPEDPSFKQDLTRWNLAETESWQVLKNHLAGNMDPYNPHLITGKKEFGEEKQGKKIVTWFLTRRPLEGKTIKLWVNAFVPGELPGLTAKVDAGPQKGKTKLGFPAEKGTEYFLTDQRAFSNDIFAPGRLHSELFIDFTTDPATVSQFHCCDRMTLLNPKTGSTSEIGKTDVSRMRFTVENLNKFKITVSLKCSVSNPSKALDKLFPNLDYKTDFTVECDTDQVDCKGEFPGFPAFEIYGSLTGGKAVEVWKHLPEPGTGAGMELPEAWRKKIPAAVEKVSLIPK